MDKAIRLTIATVSRGDYDGLCKTIDSVVCQEDKLFEFILVLSDYSAKELNLIRSRAIKIPFIEIKDNGEGIYPAMNLALGRSSGSHILFLNGGDSFFSEHSVALVNGEIARCGATKNIGFSVCLNFQKFKYLRKSSHQGRCFDRRIFYPPHQGFVALVDKKNVFSSEYGTSGDTFWMKNQLKKYDCVFSDLILSNFELGGVSNNPRNMTNFKTQPFKKTLKYLLFRIIGEENYYRAVFSFSGFRKL
jgi:hypothetical protein